MSTAEGTVTAPPGNAAPPANTGAPAANGSGSGVSEPWAKEWIQPDFTLNHKALERLPDHLKPFRPTMEKYGKFEDFVHSRYNQEMLVGKKGLSPLPPDAPKEVVAERKALFDTINGVPKTPQEYGIKRPDTVPEDQWNQPLADSFAAWAHENSVSPQAAQKLLAIQAEAVKGQLAAQEVHVREFFAQQDKVFEDTIRAENIPADRAQALVERGARDLGLDLENPDVQTFLKNANARTMAMRHAIATGESEFKGAGGSSGTPVSDPMAEANDIVKNPANPLHTVYWNKDGKIARATHQAAVEKVNNLFRQAHDRMNAKGGKK